jgi:hypothetical protein
VLGLRQQQPGLGDSEGDGDVGGEDRPLGRAGRGIQAARQVAGDDDARSAAGEQRLEHGGRGTADRTPRADPQHAVDDEVGTVQRLDRGPGQLPVAQPDEGAAGPAQRRRPGLVVPRPAQQRHHPGAPPAQQGARQEGVAAVVAGPDQQDRPGAGDPATHAPQRPGAGRRQAGGGHRHQVGTLGEAGGVGGGHVLRPPPGLQVLGEPRRRRGRLHGAAHPSAMQVAEAMPASWERLRCSRATPSCSIRASTVPTAAPWGRRRPPG